MKAAAMIGPLVFGLCVSLYDDRVGLLSVIVVIFLGTLVFYFFWVEKSYFRAISNYFSPLFNPTNYKMV